jgi:hypothetical protein
VSLLHTFILIQTYYTGNVYKQVWEDIQNGEKENSIRFVHHKIFWEGETRGTHGNDKELPQLRKGLLITRPVTKFPAFYGTQTFL